MSNEKTIKKKTRVPANLKPAYYNKEEMIKLDTYMVFTIKILFIKNQILKNEQNVLIKVC